MVTSIGPRGMILEAMDILRVEAALLRANLPDLTLRQG